MLRGVEYNCIISLVLWVVFVVGSLVAPRFFPEYYGFPLSTKTNIPKLQFDLESEGQ